MNVDVGDVVIAGFVGTVTGGLDKVTTLVNSVKTARNLRVAIGSGGAVTEQALQAASNGESYRLVDAVTDAGLGAGGAFLAGKGEQVVRGMLDSSIQKADEATNAFIKASGKSRRSGANSTSGSRTRKRTHKRHVTQERVAAKKMRHMNNSGLNAEKLNQIGLPKGVGGVVGGTVGNIGEKKETRKKE